MRIKSDIQRRLTVLKLEDMQDMNKTEQAKIGHKDRACPGGKLSKRSKMMDSTGFPRPLKLQQIVEDGIRAYQFVDTSTASPWNKYKKRFSLDLGGLVIIADRKHTSNKEGNVVVVKCISGSENSDKLRMIDRIQHENFVNYFEFYDFDRSFYLVSQGLVASLAEIVMCPDYPTEIELAAILGQILNGLFYLSTKGLEHGSLTCSNILLGSQGIVKICWSPYKEFKQNTANYDIVANQENCCDVITPNKCSKKDIAALGIITMKLMQKYTKDEGIIGVDDMDRWPMDSHAVGFLSAITSATSISELLKNPLIKTPWRPGNLELLVFYSLVSAFRRHTPLPNH